MESGMSEPLRHINGNKIPNITVFDNSKKISGKIQNWECKDKIILER